MRDSAERRKRTCSWPDKPMSSRMGWPRLLRACLLFVIERAKLIGWKQIPSERHLPMLLQECRDEPEEEMQSWAMGICGVSAELAYIDGAQRTRMTHSMFFFNHGIASRSEQPCLGLLVYWLKKRGRHPVRWHREFNFIACPHLHWFVLETIAWMVCTRRWSKSRNGRSEARSWLFNYLA